MATRSTIAIAREDGTVAKIYCHWDGYLEYNGDLLVKYYNTPEKVEALIALGDLSALNETIGVQHPFSAWESAEKDGDRWEQLYFFNLVTTCPHFPNPVFYRGFNAKKKCILRSVEKT